MLMVPSVRSMKARGITIRVCFDRHAPLGVAGWQYRIADLSEGEEEGHVAADALLLQVLTCSDAFPGGSNLHTMVWSDLT